VEKQQVWVGAIHAEIVDHLPITIVETESFREDALEVLTEEDLVEMKMRIATNPKVGTVIPQTGGVRELRYPLKGIGQQDGIRIRYYYHSDCMPIFLIAFYPKDEKCELTTAEKKQVRQFVKQLVATYSNQSLRVVK